MCVPVLYANELTFNKTPLFIFCLLTRIFDFFWISLDIVLRLMASNLIILLGISIQFNFYSDFQIHFSRIYNKTWNKQNNGLHMS